MADTQRIAQILGKLGWAYDSGNLDYFETVYADDARFTISIDGMGQVGDYGPKDAIMELYRGAKAAQDDQRRHLVSNIFFEDETETSVTAMSNLTLLATKDGEIKVLSAGQYTDRFVLVEGAWLLQHRDLALDLPY